MPSQGSRFFRGLEYLHLSVVLDERERSDASSFSSMLGAGGPRDNEGYLLRRHSNHSHEVEC